MPRACAGGVPCARCCTALTQRRKLIIVDLLCNLCIYSARSYLSGDSGESLLSSRTSHMLRCSELLVPSCGLNFALKYRFIQQHHTAFIRLTVSLRTDGSWEKKARRVVECHRRRRACNHTACSRLRQSGVLPSLRAIPIIREQRQTRCYTTAATSATSRKPDRCELSARKAQSDVVGPPVPPPLPGSRCAQTDSCSTQPLQRTTRHLTRWRKSLPEQTSISPMLNLFQPMTLADNGLAIVTVKPRSPTTMSMAAGIAVRAKIRGHCATIMHAADAVDQPSQRIGRRMPLRVSTAALDRPAAGKPTRWTQSLCQPPSALRPHTQRGFKRV